jgi:hypothetical protein
VARNDRKVDITREHSVGLISLRLQLLGPKRTAINLAPNAGQQRAFGSVMILAWSADFVSAVERKFITPENALCVVLILTTS